MKTKIFLTWVCLLWLGACSQNEASKPTTLAYNVNVKDFTLTSTEGSTIGLSDYKDKFLVVHIATTWCPYCNAEAPYLEKIHTEYKDKNVEVLIIDVKEPKDKVNNLIKERFNLSFPVLLDSDGSVAASLAPKEVLPDLARDEIMIASNLLIDPQGKIQFMSLLDTKEFDVELVDLRNRLDELL